MAESPIEVSVIIVNYNTFYRTMECVKSVKEELVGRIHEVLIVDNASDDRDPSAFVEHFSDLHLIRNRLNKGFGKGVEQGMQMAQGKFFLVLNSDCKVLPGCLEKCLASMGDGASSGIDALGCTVLTPEGEEDRAWYSEAMDHRLGTTLLKALRSSYIGKKLLPPPRSGNKKGEAWNELRNGCFRVGGLYGAFILMRREIWERHLGFDPDFFLYSEDIELFRNRWRDHVRTGVRPDAYIQHEKGASGKGESAKAIQEQKVLSHYLYWYKIGYLQFTFYMIIEAMNLLFDTLMFPFFFKKWFFQDRYISRLKKYPHALFRIPVHSNRYGARPSDLRVKEFRK